VVVFSLSSLLITIGLAACLHAESSTAQTNGSDSFVDGLMLDAESPPTYSYNVIQSFHHDCGAFTQGLVYSDDIFYEGTGQRGQSNVRKVNPDSGEVIQQHDIADQYFGEGIVLWEDRIVQLTWQAGIGFVYNKDTFEQLQQFSYPTEGWGITQDGVNLIMSDGTALLYSWDAETLQSISATEILDSNDRPVVMLNELEYIDGFVFANIWQTDRIAIIDLDLSHVVAWIDLSGLLDISSPCGRPDVLNGIAYDAEADRLFVTGKYWPRLYQIELLPQN
jgi:glutamine cyclotransferase